MKHTRRKEEGGEKERKNKPAVLVGACYRNKQKKNKKKKGKNFFFFEILKIFPCFIREIKKSNLDSSRRDLGRATSRQKIS